MKWVELNDEQKAKVIDYNCSPECIADDAWESARDYAEALKQGRDAVFITLETLIDWWDNCDDEIQQEVLDD